MFVDVAKIHIKAGDGGDGAVSFHREKYVANGGPDGGDGGKGGDIIFVADTNLSTLADFRYKRKYKGENGQNGGKSRCSGKKGQDTIIKVPLGTVIKEAETGRIMADLSDAEPVVIAKGGRGGWGNMHFATATRQIPRFSKSGKPGEEFEVQMELKLLADVGLLGYPNVGKSTLVSVVSEAKPKIANYHFTTLTPVLGVVRVAEEKSFVMADIPGVIEGAGEGVGLGHEFLRHIERCRLIVHVVDVSGSEGRNAIEDFETINKELAVFSEELSKRPQIVAANKIDMAEDEQIEEFRAYIEGKGLKFFEMSAAIAHGTKELINCVAAELDKLPPIVKYEAEAAPEPVIERNKYEYSIEMIDDGVYEVTADWLIPIMNKTNPNDYESLQYFQRMLTQSGIIDGLRKAGINEGDTVVIYDFEFDFVN
ncbi:MAG: GTPase ObgE [Clostridia bacterium]|nr:GTPase ObgE [Clostridia bacterium]